MEDAPCPLHRRPLGGGLSAYAAKKAWATYDKAVKSLTFYYGEKNSLSETDAIHEFWLNEGANVPEWFEPNNTSIVKIVFDPSFADARPTTCYRWFSDMQKLTSIEGFEYLNTSKVTNMEKMFCFCMDLQSLDLSYFDTSNVTNMSYMFSSCYDLESLNLASFNTSKVEEMSGMFNQCWKLQDIYVSELFVVPQKDLKTQYMFNDCRKLPNYDKYETDYHRAYYGTKDSKGGYLKNATDYCLPIVAYADGTLTFHCSLKTSLEKDEYYLNEDGKEPGWISTNKEKITKVVFGKSFFVARPTSCYHWFYSCTNLENIEGMENVNTSKVTNMEGMFYNCSSLKSLNVLNLSTSNVANMSSMFGGCSNLVSLNLENFNMGTVKRVDKMFKDCSNLTTIYAKKNFLLGNNVQSGDNMFTGCTKLVGDIVYDENKVDKTYAKFEGGYLSDRLYTRPWVKYVNGTLTFLYGYKKTLDANMNEYILERISSWHSNRSEVTRVVFDKSFASARPTDCANWFERFRKLTTIDGIENLNTSNTVFMESMFEGCSQLTSLDFSAFDTQNVKRMESMFEGCSQLTSLDLSTFDTQNVQCMDYMFYGCSNLTTIYASDKFIVQEGTRGVNMFVGCTKLQGDIAFDRTKTNIAYAKLDGGYFKDKNLGDRIWWKFADGTLTIYYGYKKTTGEGESIMKVSRGYPNWCEKSNDVTKIVFDKSFAQARPTSCYQWFYQFKKLTTIEGIENFNTSNVKTMAFMFEHCSSLKSLDLSSFDTRNVSNMKYMFNECWGLTSLDLSNFDTRNVTEMSRMFYECRNLTTIYASDKFVVKEGANGGDMFLSCPNIIGEIPYNGTIDATYAKVEGGYFTDKVYTRPWVKYADGTLAFKYGYKKTPGKDEYLMNEGNNAPQWYTDHIASDGTNSEITKVVFDKMFSVIRPTSCYKWFYGLNRLDNIEGIENLNTSEVTNMSGMFGLCESLTSLELAHFDTQKVADMSYMFSGAEKLQTIYVSDQFVLQNGIKSLQMFYGCKSLKGDIAYDANYVDKTYAKSIGGYFIDRLNQPRPWVKYANGTLTFQYGVHKVLDKNEYLLNEERDSPEWDPEKTGNSSITKVVFDKSFAQARPTNCFCWFADLVKLKTIEGFENLNTSKVTSMLSMFWNCQALTSLDLSHFDTKNVEDMRQLFYKCSSLTSLDLSNFNTSKAEKMNVLFKGCTALQSIYVGEKFNTDKVSSYSRIFEDCAAIIYSAPNQYEATKTSKVFEGRTVKPYVSINPDAEYGTLCVPVGSSLVAGSFTGFDKLYQVTNADKNKGTITLAEAKSIEPGVPYVYHRYLEGVDFDGKNDMSVITFDVDENASAAVTAPKNEGSLLKGTFESMVAKGGSYILQTDGNFHPVAADNKTLKVGAYRAYLDLSSTELGGGDEGFGEAKAYSMVFEDGEATGIDRINGDGSNKGIYDQADLQPKVYFDLMGRKVAAPQKGEIYIVNGKKVVYNK